MFPCRPAPQRYIVASRCQPTLGVAAELAAAWPAGDWSGAAVSTVNISGPLSRDGRGSADCACAVVNVSAPSRKLASEGVLNKLIPVLIVVLPRYLCNSILLNR